MQTSGILFDFRRHFNAEQRGNREKFAHISLFNQFSPGSDWDVLERTARYWDFYRFCISDEGYIAYTMYPEEYPRVYILELVEVETIAEPLNAAVLRLDH